jgi:glutaredoxin-related protein
MRLESSIQLKTFQASNSLLTLLASYDTILFYTSTNAGLPNPPSSRAFALLNIHEVDARTVDIFGNPCFAGALTSYSGWQYFSQLYVRGEFIGGSLMMEEFLRSGEYDRIMERAAPPYSRKDPGVGRKNMIGVDPDHAVAGTGAGGGKGAVNSTDRVNWLRRGHTGQGA